MIGWERGHILFELWVARWALLDAIGVTCSVAFGGTAIGLAIGGMAAAAAVFGPRWLRGAVDLYVYVLRGIPLLVTIFFAYFGIAALWRALSAEQACILAIGLFAGAYLTEAFRGAILAVPRGQIEAARAIGLPFWAVLVDVIAPLSIRRALPSVVNIMVEMVKSSALVSALGVGDLLLTGQQIAMRTLLIPQVYFTLWLLYLAVNLALTSLGRWLEERYRHVVY